MEAGSRAEVEGGKKVNALMKALQKAKLSEPTFHAIGGQLKDSQRLLEEEMESLKQRQGKRKLR